MKVLQNQTFTKHKQSTPSKPSSEQVKKEECELIERAKTGDGSAFDEMTKRYSEKAYSIAYQMLAI